MRLFEVASVEDARTILDVIKGLANNDRIPSKLPFHAFKNYIGGDEIGIGTPDALVAFKNAVDPEGDVIQDIQDNGQGDAVVILNTNVQAPEDDAAQTPTKASSPSVDRMASANSKKLSPDI